MWTIGLTGKFHFTDAVALFFDPQVGVMLSHRDLYKEQLFIPVELQFQTTAARFPEGAVGCQRPAVRAG